MYIATLTAQAHKRRDQDGSIHADVWLMFGESYICSFRSEDWWELTEGPDRQKRLEQFIAEKFRTLLRAPA